MAAHSRFPSKSVDEEIWSEYSRIKHELMDYDQNLREAIANVRVLQRFGTGSTRSFTHLAKAQKHVSHILDLGMNCGAIPSTANKDDLLFCERVAKGDWRVIEDFERCQRFFRSCYIETSFYSITKEKEKALAPHEM